MALGYSSIVSRDVQLQQQALQWGAQALVNQLLHSPSQGHSRGQVDLDGGQASVQELTHSLDLGDCQPFLLSDGCCCPCEQSHKGRDLSRWETVHSLQAICWSQSLLMTVSHGNRLKLSPNSRSKVEDSPAQIHRGWASGSQTASHADMRQPT